MAARLRESCRTLHFGYDWRSGEDLYWFITPALSFGWGPGWEWQIGFDFLKVEIFCWWGSDVYEHTD